MASWQDAPVVSSGSSWRDAPVVEETPRKAAQPPAATSKPKAAPKTVTRQDEIKRIAREQLARENAGRKEAGFFGDLADFGEAARAGITNAITLGNAPRISAFIASKKDGVSYDDALTYAREREKAQRELSIGGDITGQLTGGVGLGTGLAAGATRVAEAGIPVISRAGNYLSNVLNLQRGQTWRNLARLGAQGAGFGAAQAAGEGRDVGEGAGAGGALALGLGLIGNTAGAVLRQTTRPVFGTAGQGLREIISDNVDDLENRQAQMSRDAGENVPLITTLRERDNNSVRDRLLRTSDDANEVAKDYRDNFVRDFGRRMVQAVTNAGGTAGMRRTNTPAELTLLRDQTADQLMAPIEGKRLDVTDFPVEDLERQAVIKAGGRVQGLRGRIDAALKDVTPEERKVLGIPADKEITEAEQLATRIMAGRGPIDATVRELETLRRLLNGAARGASRNGIAVDAEIFKNASDQLVDFISRTYPDYRKMIDTYAGQSRMLEGFLLSGKGQRVSDLTDKLEIDNMNTSEGTLGRRLGEFYRQREAAAGGTGSAVRLARDLADIGGDLTAPPTNLAQPGSVTENMGPEAADQLRRAADVQYQTLQRIQQAGGTNVANLSDDALKNPATLAYGIAALSPNAMQVSRFRFLAHLSGLLPTGYSPQVARNMTDMLFSGDPAQTQRAINALRRLGVWEQAQRSLGAPSGVLGGQMASPDQPVSPQQPTGTFMIEDNPPGLVEPGNIDLDARKVLQDGPNYKTEESISIGTDKGETIIPTVVDGKKLTEKEAIEHFRQTGEHLGIFRTPQEAEGYAQRLHLRQEQKYKPQASEDQQFDTLANKVEQVESTGKQDAVSSAGAIGVMQVMPGTGPEAAELAGVEWDPKRFKEDEDYNRQLGRAYLKEMLRLFDGDETLAVAAYNAGPGAVRRALAKGGDWVVLLPAETQDYIQKVLG